MQIDQCLNMQQYKATKLEVYCIGDSPERMLLIDCANRLDMLTERITKFNNLPWYMRLFKNI